MPSPWGTLLFRDRRGPERPSRARGGLARYFLFVLLPLTLLPLAVFAGVAYYQARANTIAQVRAQLETIATLKEDQIKQWRSAREADVNNLARAPDVLNATNLFLGNDRAAMRAAETSLTDRLEDYLIKNPGYESLFLVQNDDGVVLLTVGKYAHVKEINFFNEASFNLARQAAQMAPPKLDPRIEPAAITVLVGAPVVDPQDGPIAVLFGIISGNQLRDIVGSANPLLGSTGQSYALSSDGYEIGLAITDNTVKPNSTGIQHALMEKTAGFGQYADAAGNPVFGAYRYYWDSDIALIVEQSTAEAFAPITNAAFLGALGTIVVVATLFSLLVVFVFTRSLTRPIQELIDGAQQLAGGNLEVKVNLHRQDELGVLANSFNRMATQLSELYASLEQRVADRTHQLATAAEVARTATSTLKTEELLARAVELIRERFGYYHVSIFILDETGQEAVLQESTGAVGARLKASGYRLRVGSGSLIGWVVANQKPHIAMDVNTDTMYLKEDQLPETRSEAAIPLRVGTRVVGVLDVQSREPNAFNESDVQVLQTLADQIAVGIENGRLFSRQSQVVRLEQLLADLTARIHQTRQLDAILENTATELGRAFGARRVVVRLSPNPPPNGHDHDFVPDHRGQNRPADDGNGHSAELSTSDVPSDAPAAASSAAEAREGAAEAPKGAAEEPDPARRKKRGLNLLDKL